MKKKVISSLMLAVLCGSVAFGSSLNIEAEEAGDVEIAGRGTLLYETDVITRKDYEEGFENYALSEATVDLTSRMRTFSNEELSNVVGVVKDYDTEELISNATISVDGEELVVTGEDGRFQIKNFPSGVYDWEISAEGYCTADYYNYDVDYADGTTIFTFYVSDDYEVIRDREEVLHGDEDEQLMTADAVMEQSASTFVITRAMGSLPELKDTIQVYYNGQKRAIDRETYVHTVLSAELYSKSYYQNLGMTSAQIVELYCAQAIAANTYVEYSQSVYSKHISDIAYNFAEVCSGTCCQVYDPTKITQFAINAASYIFYTIGENEASEILLYRPSSSSYNYMCSQFFSSCFGNGTETNANDPALRAVSCTDITSGATSKHHYGMCQMGAANRAKNGETASEILMYYYTNCSIEICVME